MLNVIDLDYRVMRIIFSTLKCIRIRMHSFVEKFGMSNIHLFVDRGSINWGLELLSYLAHLTPHPISTFALEET